MAIAAGGNHSLALSKDGFVTAWGSALYGNTSVPIGLSNVVQVAAGEYFSLVLRSDGSVVELGASSSPM